MKKKHETTHLDLVYGIHPIVELLKARKRALVKLYTTKSEPKAFQAIKPLLSARTEIHYVSREMLTTMAGNTDHQGVVGHANPLVIRKKFFDPEKQPFLLLLDGVQDVRNLGAILRSAYCTGVDGVILPQKNTAPLNAVALKSSAGLAEHLEIYYASSASSAVVELKKAGYNLYMAVLENGKDATQVTYKRPLCLVIGSEGIGISKEIQKSGELITLPQRSSDISYNASVAAGILLFTLAYTSK